MKRKIYQKLLDWKAKYANKYALLIEGARRVGKSYIVEEFAKTEYEHHLIIDFAKASPAVKRVFDDYLDDLDEFFLQLELRTHVHLVPRKSLIVFDEVQRFPRAREAVKYLVADGRFHYIETGSLISIKKNVDGIIIPSEEMRLQMHPMDFEEFLEATGRDGMMPLIRKRFEQLKPMGQTDHRMAAEAFRQYLVVGGMPQSVAAFADSRDMAGSEAAKRMILRLYGDDIGKFAGRLKDKVRQVWRSLPAALGRTVKQFNSGLVGENVRMRELLAPFNWLEESMTVNIARNVSDPNVGFAMNADVGSLKCYMADTGLLVSLAFDDSSLGADGIAWKILTGKIEVNKGMLVENVVAQMLKASGRSLYFYCNNDRENAENRMEVDFLLSKGTVGSRRNVIAVEVKSRSGYTTVSLDRFRRKFSSYMAQGIVIHPGDIAVSDGVVHLPLYMTGLLGENGIATGKENLDEKR